MTATTGRTFHRDNLVFRMSKDICRICLGNTCVNYPLFEAFENTMIISNVLNKCLENKISEDLNLPSKICKNCYDIFIQFYNLTIELDSATETLTKLIEEPIREQCNSTYICDICGKTFTKEANLRDHLDGHSKTYKYQCSMCGKQLKFRTSLSRHLKAHTHQKQYMCEQCGAKFAHSSTLQTHHVLMHVKKKNFKCVICERTFALKSILDKHVGRHRKVVEKNYRCKVCNMDYLDKSSLKRHCDVKHGVIVEYNCGLCSKGFNTKSNLKRHEKVEHT